ncbi:MAG: 30S ribosomal protein S18 [Candidatus Omnitrophica bacterium]|nr:30S ribosomal protein S18 [Candidatus Omnitrophota bacterium]
MKVKQKSTTRTGGRGGKLGAKGAKGGRGGKTAFKKRDTLGLRKKFCRLCQDKVNNLDYKDSKKLEMYIRDRAKMVPRRVSGACAKHQRRIAEAIKKARFMSLIPYVR